MSRKKPKSLFGGFNQSSFQRSSAVSKPPKSVLIVTEGRNTEPLYFKTLADHWGLHPHVAFIEPGGEGIPSNLVEKALAIREQREQDEKDGKLAINQLGYFDEIWIVFDTEHAARHGRLTDGVEAARKYGIHIAHSTPCFEFWLSVHYALRARPMNTCAEACALLEENAGIKRGAYSKETGLARAFVERLIPLVPVAVKHARQLEKQMAEEPFPANPSTSVHHLVESLHEALPEEMKKRFPLR